MFDAPTLLTNDGDCIGPQLGYKIPDSLLSLAGVPDSLASAILTGIFVFLVLHLVAAGFAFIAFISAFFLASHGLSILSLLLSILSAILSTAMFALDLALVLTAKSQIPNLTSDGLQADYGPGVWMILTAMLCSWLAVILLSARVCYCCGVRRQVDTTTFSLIQHSPGNIDTNSRERRRRQKDDCPLTLCHERS